MQAAKQIVTRLLEDDERIDPKAFAMGEYSRPKEISIVGRRWHRPVYGGTYHTADIRVDGKEVARTERHYGYGDHYLETGWQWLEDNGIVPRRDEGHASPWRAAQDLGIELNYYAIDVKRQRDL
jgi:hypothetical protein